MSTEATRTLQPVVGTVVVSHEQVAFAMVEAVRRVVGRLSSTAVACITTGEDSAAIIQKVAQACGQVDDGAGVVILVDVYGSTPYHVCMSMLDGTRAAEVVCGVNLPMLLKLAMLDRSRFTPEALALELRDVGRRAVRLGSELTGKVTPGEKG